MRDDEKKSAGSRETRAAGILIWILILSWHAMTVAQDDKECLDCHPTYFEELTGEYNHRPFEEHDCYACHKFHGFRNATELYGPIKSICSECHDVIAEIDPEFLHAPIEDDEVSCLNCHDPHSSDVENFLTEPMKALCIVCHDAPVDFSGIVHAPYGDTNCVVCHDPHGSPFGAFFHLPIEYICIECHIDDLENVEPSLLHAASGERNCENCHNGHRSSYDGLLKAEPGYLCRLCHLAFYEGQESPARHTILETEDCVVCHKPHFEKGGNHLVAGQPEICFACHSEIEELVAADGAHAAAVDGCSECHDPHFQRHKSGQPAFCGKCHDVEDSEFSARHLEINPTMCSECHEPHGSASEKLLRPNGHPPFVDKECVVCHELGQNQAQLQRNELCLDCHDVEPGDNAHRDRGINGKACIQCHSPHASARDKLLRIITSN